MPRSPGESGARRSAPRQRPPTAHPDFTSTTPAPDPPEFEHAGSATPPDNPHEHTPGHPRARGTLPMARYLTDPAIEDEIQALAREAPPMTEDQRAKLARLLRLNRNRRDHRQAA